MFAGRDDLTIAYSTHYASDMSCGMSAQSRLRWLQHYDFFNSDASSLRFD